MVSVAESGSLVLLTTIILLFLIASQINTNGKVSYHISVILDIQRQDQSLPVRPVASFIACGAIHMIKLQG